MRWKNFNSQSNGSESDKLDIQIAIWFIESLIKFLITSLRNFGKMDCDDHEDEYLIVGLNQHTSVWTKKYTKYAIRDTVLFYSR